MPALRPVQYHPFRSGLLIWLALGLLLGAAPAWALSDQDYRQFLAQSPEFKQADQALNQAYRAKLGSLDPAGQAALKADQKAWLAGRDAQARALVQGQGLTPALAYARLSQERAARVAAFSPPAATPGNWAGSWERVDSDSFTTASLRITQESAGGFSFEMEAFNGGNSGSVEGRAVVRGGGASFSGEEGCRLEFKLSKGEMIVEASQGCLNLAGMGVFFSGRFARAGSRPAPAPEPPSPEEQALAQLTGTHYQLFRDTMQMMSEDPDLDKLGATVRSYGVRGLMTAQESIVMQAPDGRLWAAVIDGEVVRYFSNDPAWQKRLPATIEDWRGRFADKAVVYMSGGKP